VGFVLYPGQPSSIEMLPVPIHRLLRLHMEVDAALSPAAGRHSFEYGIWMPTVTLGHTGSESMSVELLVRLYEGPVEVMLDRIELIRTDPFEIISTRTLPR